MKRKMDERDGATMGDLYYRCFHADTNRAIFIFLLGEPANCFLPVSIDWCHAVQSNSIHHRHISLKKAKTIQALPMKYARLPEQTKISFFCY